MTTSLLLCAAVKASLIAVCGLFAVHLLPPAWIRARRKIALLAMWSLLVLPWVSLPSLSAPVPHLPEVNAGALLTAGLLLAWGLGLILRCCRLGMESRLLLQIAGSGTPCGNRLLVVEGLASPCMWGVVDPCILMPAAAKDWPPAQWQAAVLHERQHIRQHDGWHRLVAALVRALFWWNPLVHALCRRLEIESELCCDEAATANSSRRAYGEMLLHLATAASFEAAPAWAARGGVRERIQRLIAPAPCGRAAAFVRSTMVAGVLALGFAAGCCIDSKPSLVQEAAVRLDADPFPLH